MTQPTIPAGYALVPVEPTEAMQLAVCELERRVGPDAVLGLSRIWSAMLAAAPVPPEAEAPAIPVGMKAWHGGDSAPDDWDGGRVIFRHGVSSTRRPGEGLRWQHFGNPCDPDGLSDIIAYTPRPPEQPTIAGEREAVARIVERLCAGADGTQPGPMAAYRQGVRNAADAILARPSVRDVEVERLREALRRIGDMSEPEDVEDIGDWIGLAFESARSIARAALSPSTTRQGDAG